MKKINRIYFILTYMFFIYPPFIWGLVEIYSSNQSDVHVTVLILNIVLLVLIGIICGAIIMAGKLHMPTIDETKYLIFGLSGNIVMYFYTFQNIMNIDHIVTIYLVLLIVLGVYYFVIKREFTQKELWIMLPVFLLYDYIFTALRGCGWNSNYYCRTNTEYDGVLGFLLLLVVLFIIGYYVYKLVLYRLLDFFKIINIIIVFVLSMLAISIDYLDTEFALTLIILWPFFLIVDFISKIVNKSYSHKMLLFYIRTFVIFVVIMLLAVAEFFEGYLRVEMLSVMVIVTYATLGISILKSILHIEVVDQNPFTVIKKSLKGPKYIEAKRFHVQRIKEQYSEELASHILIDDRAITYVAVIDDQIIGFISTYIQYLSHPLETIEEAYINVLEVHPEYRNQGIATKLIQMTEHFFKTHKVHQIRAWSTQEKYEAIHLWKKLGYTLSPACIHIKDKNINVDGYYVTKNF